MQTAPLPDNEEQRLIRLRGMGILDTLPQKAFDDISALAQVICGTPVALITFIDRDRQWFKSRVGIDVTETPRALSFCSHAIHEPDKVMVVEDMNQDPRFQQNPLVTGPHKLRFYAGAPIVTSDGFALGAVCVVDQMPRQLHSVQISALKRLSGLVSTLIEHERARQVETTRSARAAHQEHEELIAMAASGLDLQAYIDADGVYRHANQTFLNYVGATRDEVIGATVKARLGDAAYSLVGSRMARAMAGETVIYQRISHFKAAGIRHMEIALLPVREPNGQVSGVVMRGRDIQELKNKEIELGETIAQLEKKSMEQERFIHILSHDLREPINAINNFTSLLHAEHAVELTPDARRYLGFVCAGGQRLARLLDDLLRYVRLDRHRLASEPVDVSTLANQLRDDVSATLAQSQGSLELDTLPTVQGDPSLLQVALKHLVANGLAFARPGVAPQLRVSATHQNGFDQIHVDDNGVGIAPEHQLSVFELFKRLQPRKTHLGSGLGLPICKRIAALHGGHVSIESEPGVGSRFTLHLPRSQGMPQ
ncbi:ATP-binding protein [Hydrogenophaga sp.]|uniref:GAF domain-containing sensor histidine kinase n=1 Tax=Hydrogenophaga sp. TaxID=1904254 RepID=UPI002721E3AF|nr:ATP-binding protein [Hydrogenophaga sp.]MDO9434488.1 ATP-binding protein [Hydrogenophaga sp.]